jgi:hypothetical protein
MNKYEKVWSKSFGRFFLHVDVQCLFVARLFLGVYADPRYERILVKRSPGTAV